MRQQHEGQEAMLSRMAQERDQREADKRGLSVAGLKDVQRKCPHANIARGTYVDSCLDCDAAMPV